MAFKLGREGRKYRTFDKPMVFKKKMNDGALAQANMDGSIDVDPSVNLNSSFGKRVIKHENKHLEQIESGRAAYNDDTVMWEDKLYFRKEVNGEAVIDGPNGRLPEGNPNHPWEAEAIRAEKQ